MPQFSQSYRAIWSGIPEACVGVLRSCIVSSERTKILYEDSVITTALQVLPPTHHLTKYPVSATNSVHAQVHTSHTPWNYKKPSSC